MPTPLLSLLLRWFVPLAVTATVFVAFYVNPPFYRFLAEAEPSFFEQVTALILLAAVLTALAALRLPGARRDKALRVWIALFALAVFFFMGEDANWGQHYFGWQPSEFFLQHNKEQETNLHNMSSWFNQKPRLMVEAWIIVACILVPLGWAAPRRWTQRFVPDALWPSRWVTPIAVLVVLLTLPKRFEKAFGVDIPYQWMLVRGSELEEFLFGYIMLAYIVLLYRHLKAAP